METIETETVLFSLSLQNNWRINPYILINSKMSLPVFPPSVLALTWECGIPAKWVKQDRTITKQAYAGQDHSGKKSFLQYATLVCPATLNPHPHPRHTPLNLTPWTLPLINSILQIFRAWSHTALLTPMEVRQMAANGYPIVLGRHVAPKHTVITDLFQVSPWPLIRVFKINNPFNYFIFDYHIQTNQLLRAWHLTH